MAVVLFDLEKAYSQNKSLREDVKTVEKWLSKQPHLPQISEHHLILFLNSCYNRVEPTKNAIDSYYTIKTHCPHLFSSLDPGSPAMLNVMDMCTVLHIEEKTPKGYKIMFSKLLNTNPDLFVHADQVKYFYMITEIALLKEGPADGHLMVYDMEGFTFAHMLKMNLMVLKQATTFLQEALPLRIKGIHVINVNSLIDKLMAMIKPVLSKEIIDMIHLHTKADEELFKMVPKRLLPNEYGGEQGTVHELKEKAKQDFLANAEYFLKEEKQRVDESKRQEKSTNYGNLFGAEGSFKKLSID